VHVVYGQLSPELTEKKGCMAGFSKAQLLPALHLRLYSLCPISEWTELSAVVQGQHPHLEQLKGNIHKEIENIPAEFFRLYKKFLLTEELDF
jgi:hypothetical protein